MGRYESGKDYDEYYDDEYYADDDLDTCDFEELQSRRQQEDDEMMDMLESAIWRLEWSAALRDATPEQLDSGEFLYNLAVDYNVNYDTVFSYASKRLKYVYDIGRKCLSHMFINDKLTQAYLGACINIWDDLPAEKKKHLSKLDILMQVYNLSYPNAKNALYMANFEGKFQTKGLGGKIKQLSTNIKAKIDDKKKLEQGFVTLHEYKFNDLLNGETAGMLNKMIVKNQRECLKTVGYADDYDMGVLIDDAEIKVLNSIHSIIQIMKKDKLSKLDDIKLHKHYDIINAYMQYSNGGGGYTI